MQLCIAASQQSAVVKRHKSNLFVSVAGIIAMEIIYRQLQGGVLPGTEEPKVAGAVT